MGLRWSGTLSRLVGLSSDLISDGSSMSREQPKPPEAEEELDRAIEEAIERSYAKQIVKPINDDPGSSAKKSG